MNIKRHLNKTVFVSISLCISLIFFGFTISRGYVTFIYQSQDRPISDGNGPVIATLHRQVSVATDSKRERIVNRPVVAKLHGLAATATSAYSDLTGRDKMKTLVWYDTAARSMTRLFSRVGFSHCSKYKNCQYKTFITKNDTHPKKPFDADVILVQSTAIWRLSPPPRRDENQAFVLVVRDSFYCSENKLKSRKWLDLFNWTMTYKLDSDFVFKYANVLERENKTDLMYKDYDKIFEGKNDKAVWFVSHCKTKSRREHYVREMQKVMGIDIFGACGRDTPRLCPKGSGHIEECRTQTTEKYKFYLAFENTLVEDYVTEKVFNWLNRDIIVVVRGGANYSRILPPGTFVDAGDFETPIKLGQYLAELAEDKVRYIDYLKRKDMYYSTSKSVPVREANCKLCESLNNLESHKKHYRNIIEWWMAGWRNYDMKTGFLKGWPRPIPRKRQVQSTHRQILPLSPDEDHKVKH